MTALQNLSRPAVVGLALLVCYLPFAWIPFLVEKQLLPYWLKIWIILPGAMLGDLITMPLRLRMGPGWGMALAILLSILMPSVLVFLLIRFPRWRWLVLGLALLGIGLLSRGAYGLYLA